MEWIVNVYALVFGGRCSGGDPATYWGARIFSAGILVFAGASLFGEFATD